MKTQDYLTYLSNEKEEQQQHTGLIPLEQVNALELFTEGGLDSLLTKIETEVSGLVFDISTTAGRKECASKAYQVARSKTTIDDAGKNLIADQKKETAKVDVNRKKARDFLDTLRDKVRQPLTDWESEQARIEGEKRMAAAAEAQRIEEEKEAALRERERLIAEKEAELAKQESERLEKERQAQAEAARKAREEQIAKDAEERAKRDAEDELRKERVARALAEQQALEAVKREQEARERAEQQAKETAERAAREAIEAVARAHREKEEAVENERLRAARDAEERDRIRRVEIVENARQEAARKTDKANRDIIYGDIISALRAEGFVEAQAHKIVRLIAEGIIPHVQITY